MDCEFCRCYVFCELCKDIIHSLYKYSIDYVVSMLKKRGVNKIEASDTEDLFKKLKELLPDQKDLIDFIDCYITINELDPIFEFNEIQVVIH